MCAFSLVVRFLMFKNAVFDRVGSLGSCRSTACPALPSCKSFPWPTELTSSRSTATPGVYALNIKELKDLAVCKGLNGGLWGNKAITNTVKDVNYERCGFFC